VRKPGLTRFRILVSSHLRLHAGVLCLAGLGSLGYAAAELLAPWPLKIILDHILLGKPAPPALRFFEPWMRTRPEWAIAAISSAILVIALLKGAFAYMQVFFSSEVGYRLVHTLRREIFGHLQRLSLSFHHRARAGELLTKVTSDTNVLKDVFAGGLLEVLSHGLILVSTFVVLFLLNWLLALTAALTLPILAGAMFTLYRRGKVSARRQREREGEVAAHIGEILQLTPLVRAFTREKSEEERFARQSGHTLAESIRTARVEAASGRAVEIINALGIWGSVLFGGLLAFRGAITPGDLLVFSSYLTGMYKPLRNLAKLSTQFSKAMASAERIEQIFAAETEPVRGGEDPGPLHGSIEFDRVTFGYEPGRPVLRDLSFRVAPGEHIALVGPSGAGKSTVASLLLRFYQPQGGRVCVDGRDIRGLDAEAYRKQIGVVLQDTLLFGATLADNIAYGKPEATRAEIERAARWASAHDFISRLPDGYDTVLSERAATLSGGQRQRISLARALLKEPAVLILDEPTSAVDSESASTIHETIANLRQGMTTLVIAHQFHAMERFDRVVVVEDGRVAEEGTHQQLLERQGPYWELFRLQRAGAEEVLSS